MLIRKSKLIELDSIMNIYEIARQYMINTKNDKQWGWSYPSRNIIKDDIIKGNSYVCIGQDKKIHGVFSLIEGQDPTYINIEGTWLNEDPYATIHRLAGDGKIGGIFNKCLEFSKEKYKNIRIDTHEDNAAMRHLIIKNGFIECGIIYTSQGDPRIAYQLLV